MSGARILQPEFIGVTRKERPCFAAERGLDRIGHTSLRMVYWGRTKGTAADCGLTPLGTHEHLRVHFLILGSGLPLLNRVGAEFIGATRKERPCFAAERDLNRLGHTSFRHRKGTALFCCRMRPRPLGHTRALECPFSDQAQGGAEFIGVARKERPCFAAERGLDRVGHTSIRMVYWKHTKETALFCCRMRPRLLWAHTSTRGSIF